MKARNRWMAGGMIVVACFATSVLAASPADDCDVHLAVQLTPDAAAPRDPGFLSSLVADPQYQLRWLHGDDTGAFLEMIGPATDDQCAAGVNQLARSSHVLKIQVVSPSEVSETEKPLL